MEEKTRICKSYMDLSGIRITEVKQDYAAAEVTITEELQNPYGFAHGGLLLTLADSVCGAAACSNQRSYVTMSSNFTFLRSAEVGDTIRAQAKVRRRGRTTCYTEVDILSGSGWLLASGSAVFCEVERPVIVAGLQSSASDKKSPDEIVLSAVK